MSQLVGICPAQRLQETQQVTLEPIMLFASSEMYYSFYDKYLLSRRRICEVRSSLLDSFPVLVEAY